MTAFKPIRLGKYLLIEKLAMGGMAEVYRAIVGGASGFQKQFAIKRILSSYSSNEEFIRMFEDEARLCSLLSHSNIAQVYDFDKADTYYLAVEFIEGKNLRQILTKIKKINQKIPIEFGLYVINEVLKGLDYAHKKRDENNNPLHIIHRDISPQNIMLSYEGAVKIVDFGIAKAKTRIDETRSGVIKGKFGYMSPEQANGETIDFRSDIFSVCIILFEMLTGKRLFYAENDMATLKKIQDCVIPKPSRINPRIGVELERIMLKGLAKDPNLRYEKTETLQKKIQEYINIHFSSYSHSEAGRFIQMIMKEEIQLEKRRSEELRNQSISYSMLDRSEEDNSNKKEFSSSQDSFEGTQTKSEVVEQQEHTESESGKINQNNSKKSSPSSDPKSIPSLLLPIESIPSQVSNIDGKTLLPSKHGPKKDEEDEDSLLKKLEKLDFTLSDNEESQLLLKKVDESSLNTNDKGDNNNNNNNPLEHTKTPNTLPQTKNFDPIIIKQHTETRPTLPYSTHGIGESAVEKKKPLPRVLLENKARKKNTSAFDEREETFSFRLSLGLRIALIFGILVFTFYGYKLLFNGTLFQLAVTKNSSQDNIKKNSKDSKRNITTYSSTICNYIVDSNPRGAEVYVDRSYKGLTPLSIGTLCGRGVTIALEKEDYFVSEKNYFVDANTNKVFQVLSKAPIGILEVSTDINCDLYIDGTLVAHIFANVPYRKKLIASRNYELNFVNKLVHFNEHVRIEENKITKKEIVLTKNFNHPKK